MTELTFEQRIAALQDAAENGGCSVGHAIAAAAMLGVTHGAGMQPQPEPGTVPDWAAGGLKRYLHDGIRPGSGLLAILRNDLREAMGRCCEMGGEGARDVWQIVNYLYNDVPSPAWGSPEKVQRWLEGPRIALSPEGEKALREAGP